MPTRDELDESIRKGIINSINKFGFDYTYNLDFLGEDREFLLEYRRNMREQKINNILNDK
jgi:hypothetical protein